MRCWLIFAVELVAHVVETHGLMPPRSPKPPVSEPRGRHKPKGEHRAAAPIDTTRHTHDRTILCPRGIGYDGPRSAEEGLSKQFLHAATLPQLPRLPKVKSVMHKRTLSTN